MIYQKKEHIQKSQGYHKTENSFKNWKKYDGSIEM